MIAPQEAPHYETGRFCAGCFWGAILHLGCVTDGTVREYPVYTPVVKGESPSPVSTPATKEGRPEQAKQAKASK